MPDSCGFQTKQYEPRFLSLKACYFFDLKIIIIALPLLTTLQYCVMLAPLRQYSVRDLVTLCFEMAT